MNNDMEPRMLVERDLIVRTRDGVGLATMSSPGIGWAIPGPARTHPLQ